MTAYFANDSKPVWVSSSAWGTLVSVMLTNQANEQTCCGGAKVQVEMADAALWLYGIAFEEVQRHIAVECRERAQVLGCLWDHCCCLTELRCAVQYEALLAQSRKGFEGMADQRQYLKGQIRSAATIPTQ